MFKIKSGDIRTNDNKSVNSDVVNVIIPTCQHKIGSNNKPFSLRSTDYETKSSRRPSLKKSRSKTKLSFGAVDSSQAPSVTKTTAAITSKPPRKIQQQKYINIINDARLQMDVTKEMELLETYRTNSMYSLHILNRLQSIQITTAYRLPAKEKHPESTTKQMITPEPVKSENILPVSWNFNNRSNNQKSSNKRSFKFVTKS